MFLAAAIQLTSTSDAETNLEIAEALIRRAANHGADLIVTPENTNFLGPHHDKVRRAEPLDGPTIARFSALAREVHRTLVIGSVNESAPGDPNRCHNTSVVIGPDGHLVGAYRKIHLFDVDVSDDVRFKESDTVAPGDGVVVVDVGFARIGLSICYDLRFPEMYQALVAAGAQVITIPSAFTLHTGKDHWRPLVRARAIETQSFVIAPGQVGRHDDSGLRNSWGHSLIVDPWGAVLAEAPDGPGIALAEVDVTRCDAVRHGMPVRAHRRPDLFRL